jgi:hypothetical protein
MQVNQYQVFVYPKAIQKLAEHTEFLARVSENAALRLYDQYEESLLFLGDSPEICPPYSTKRPIDGEFRYHLFGKRYRMVFEIDGASVFVYDIQDCRQDYDKYLILKNRPSTSRAYGWPGFTIYDSCLLTNSS